MLQNINVHWNVNLKKQIFFKSQEVMKLEVVCYSEIDKISTDQFPLCNSRAI